MSKKTTKRTDESAEQVLTKKSGASADNLSQEENKKTNKKNASAKDKAEEEKVVRVRRIKASHEYGLTDDQVRDRIEKGQVNTTPNTNVKTYRSIILENTVTFFNILCVIVAVALICVGQIANTLFMLIIIANTLIGIIQEIRAKRTIEKLSLLTAPVVMVVREGREIQITTSEVVLDDIVHLTLGKQIVADCTLINGSVEVNESLLTGESVPIRKQAGDTLLSGSFITSGSCYARVEKVGKNSYLEQLAQRAKKYNRPKSELFRSLKLIVKVIGFIVIPLAVLMFWNNSNHFDFSQTVTKTAGSIVGMIPAGMFLLSSVALAVSVMRLARKKALVQDLYCVEMLARVNVLCLDKTGTITDGTMNVYNCIEIDNESDYTLKRIMGSMLSSLNDNNQTSQALINYFGYNKELKATETMPFSSARKYSAVTFENLGTYILGASEFVMPTGLSEKVQNMVEQYSKDGYRVLLLAHSNGNIKNESVPKDRSAVALLILEDRIREDAISTIKWFKENGVKVKIISGDNPLTVAEIAKRVGVDNTEALINLEGLSEKQVIAAANKYTVFGRVTPEQKAILVKAIKSEGNTVAMTGDGVNDILALKEADCSIAMASGSEAVRSVSHMVLLTSEFSSMPETVFEGRRVINNVQKASALFFMKTIFTILFSILVIAFRQPYPFEPLQLIMLEYFVIGIPSFFLAFQPNKNRVEGKFIYNLIKNALPGALTLLLNVCAVYAFVYFTQNGWANTAVLSSMCTIILTFTGLALLLRLCKPVTVLTGILWTSMLIICSCCILFAPHIFLLVPIGLENILYLIILGISAPFIIDSMFKILDKIKI